MEFSKTVIILEEDGGGRKIGGEGIYKVFPPLARPERRRETLCIGFAGQWVVASSHSNRCHRRSIYRVRQSRESDLPPRLRLPIHHDHVYVPRRVPPPPPPPIHHRPRVFLSASFVFRSFIPPIDICAAERIDKKKKKKGEKKGHGPVIATTNSPRVPLLHAAPPTPPTRCGNRVQRHREGGGKRKRKRRGVSWKWIQVFSFSRGDIFIFLVLLLFEIRLEIFGNFRLIDSMVNRSW